MSAKKKQSIAMRNFRQLLSAPFIYGMIIPAVIWDISIFIYQNTAIRLYGIPLAKRSDYVKFDRKQLSYLTWWEKINCIYCSYVNGLLAYGREVAGRTEMYWCPIKHIHKKVGHHDWEQYFAESDDKSTFHQLLMNNEGFRERIENSKKTR